jgi:tetratricopeptide (TPR) repeat protein
MSRYRKEIVLCLLLAISTLAVYGQVINHEFVSYDDDYYVTENPIVKSGWTLNGVAWAFKTKHHSHWHPLTWLSHMTDCQFFGLAPAGHHLTSLLIHIANTILLFLVLRRMTGATLSSGFAAALFALHPLHVESVAWVADRKDVLCALFWLLAIVAYSYYAEKPGVTRYSLVLLAWSLGLMAKPMVVTLPLILLLMDYWPLRRLRVSHLRGNGNTTADGFSNLVCPLKPARVLILEKLPFLLLVAASVVVTVSFMRIDDKTLTLAVWDIYPTKTSVTNAMVSYVSYIGKMLWPTSLAIPYPQRGWLAGWQVGGAAALILSVSILVLRVGPKHPYLPVGWLWYLVSLTPVIGLVTLGPVIMADRYTYIPLIGLFIMISWGVPDALKSWRFGNLVVNISAGVILLSLMTLTWFQVSHWNNSFALFTNSVKRTARNSVAYNNLGVALEKRGHTDDAIKHYREALRIKPNSAEAHNNLGVALEKRGHTDDAIKHYREALRIKPDYEQAHNNLGIALQTKGHIDDAIKHYREAIWIKPDYEKSYYNLGVALQTKGRLDDAIDYYREALRIKPDFLEVHYNLGVALRKKGRIDDAIKHYREALRIKPDYEQAHYNLGIALQTKGRLDDAIKHYREALRIKPDYVEAHNNLGIAFFRKGNLDMAAEHLQEAVQINPDNSVARNNLRNILMLKKQSQ